MHGRLANGDFTAAAPLQSISADAPALSMQDGVELGRNRMVLLWAARLTESNSFRWMMPRSRARHILFGPRSFNLLHICGLLGVRIFTLDKLDDGPKRMTVMVSDQPMPNAQQDRAMIKAFKLIRALCFLVGELPSAPQLHDLPMHVTQLLADLCPFGDAERAAMAPLLDIFRRHTLPELSNLEHQLRPLLDVHAGLALAALPLASAAQMPDGSLDREKTASLIWTMPDGIVRDRLVASLPAIVERCSLLHAWADKGSPEVRKRECRIYFQSSYDAVSDHNLLKDNLRKAAKAAAAICTTLGRPDLAPQPSELPDFLALGTEPLLSVQEKRVALRWHDKIGARKGGLASNTDEDLRTLIWEVVTYVPARQPRLPLPSTLDATPLPAKAPSSTRNSEHQSKPHSPGAVHAKGVQLDSLQPLLKSVTAILQDLHRAEAALNPAWQSLVEDLHAVTAKFVITPLDSMSQIAPPEDDAKSAEDPVEEKLFATPEANGCSTALEAFEAGQTTNARIDDWVRTLKSPGQARKEALKPQSLGGLEQVQLVSSPSRHPARF